MPKPLIHGGGQEKGHRSGTENTLSVIGFGAAATVAARISRLKRRVLPLCRRGWKTACGRARLT